MPASGRLSRWERGAAAAASASVLQGGPCHSGHCARTTRLSRTRCCTRRGGRNGLTAKPAGPESNRAWMASCRHGMQGRSRNRAALQEARSRVGYMHLHDRSGTARGLQQMHQECPVRRGRRRRTRRRMKAM